MSGENTKVYFKQGGDEMVVEAGGKVTVKTGGIIAPEGGQAAAITDLTAITGGESPTEAEHNAVITAVNSVLAALRDAGIIAAA